MCKVVHCKKESYDVYIGRPSKWGNKFEIGKDGTREEVIEKYKEWILQQPELLASLEELRDKTLGCWCSPKACHGDVLVKLLQQKETPCSEKRVLDVDNTSKKLGCGCDITLPIDWNNIPLDCVYTWDLICDGNTKGVFQLESGLGKSWAKKCQPRNIEELADLISVLRPGCLEAKLDGKSLTQHYADRKSGKDRVEYIHPALALYLEKTYGILIFQEEILNIAKGLAGYTLGEADNLRKCVAKGSVVYTKEGPRRIEEIKHGSILTLDKNNKLYFARLKRVWFSGKQKVYQISTSNGYSIKLTKNHEVFTNLGWKKVKDLTSEDFLILPDKYRYGGNNNFNDNEILIISYILSEGCHTFNKSRRTVIYNQDINIINKLTNAIKEEFGDDSFKIYNQINNVKSIVLKGVALQWAHKHIKTALSREKEIPKSLLNFTKNKCRLFLSSFFEAEGTVNKQSIAIYSTSLSMLLDIQSLFLRDSIYSSLCEKHTTYKNKPYLSYVLNICNRQSLAKFYNLHKEYGITDKFDKIKQILESDFEGNQDSSFLIPKNFIKECFGKENLCSIIGNARCSSTVYNSNLTYDKSRVINNMVGSSLIEDILNFEYKFISISKIEEMEEEDTYDFETEDDSHCGFVNGILVHNSIGKKIAADVAKHRKTFTEGCKKTNTVPEDIATQIFDWIEKSQRYSFNKSILPNTLVQTKYGYKTIDNIKIGEQINSPYGWTSVLNKFEHGIQEVYEIETESGKQISCTLEHKFLCDNGDIEPLWKILQENLSIIVK